MVLEIGRWQVVEFKPIGMLGGSSIDWKISNLIPAAFYMNEPRFYQGGGFNQHGR